MKNYKIIIFDVGNTLIDSACGRISQTLLADLHALRAKHYILGLATLRNKSMLRDLSEAFDFDFLIMMNGGLVQLNGKTVLSAPMDCELKNRIVSQAQNLGITVTEYTQDELTYAIVLHNAVGRFTPSDEYNYCAWEHSKNIDICAKGVSKSTALNYICKQLNISLDSVIAFGDGFNDVEILENAGFSVAMRGAPTQLVDVADMVTETAANDGISLALRKMEIL